jgi:DNA polymerase (family 10)
MATADKSTVVKALRDMSAYLQLKGENGFKTRAYDLGAERIAGVTDDLATLVAQQRLTQLPGIGESLAAKIAELVTTGKLSVLEALKAEFPPKVLDLLEVQDLGPKKVKALVEQLQVGSVEELEQACKDGRVRTLKGFGAKTEEKLLAAVALRRRAGGTQSRRKLSDVLPQAQALLDWVKGAPGVVRASLGGSVRRGKETVADADIIASAPDPAAVFSHFLASPLVGELIGQGESKASVRLKGTELQIDLRVLPDEDFATALHHFTGSKAHHIHLRSLALEKGFTLSEWGVYRVEPGQAAPEKGQSKHEVSGRKVKVSSEAALYALLGMQEVPPELREDWGEIEAAQAHRLPVDLITREAIRGNVHAHSTWSDGKGRLEDMVRAAQALGLSYFTVTEHSQSSGYAGGLSVARLEEQWAEIDRLQERFPDVRLLKGVESDILEDGSLDYPDAVLAKLDVVIGSIHQRYGQDEDAMTRRVLRAFDNPHLQIWGHPTGRLLTQRDPVPLRMDEVLEKAAKQGVIIEVNGCPNRLDLSSEHVRLALQKGLKLCLSTDAHATHELGAHLGFAVVNARRGWARVGDVINTHDVKGFMAALRRG